MYLAEGGAPTLQAFQNLKPGPAMKPLWTQTLVWIAAALVALLFALAGPDGFSGVAPELPHGASTPR